MTPLCCICHLFSQIVDPSMLSYSPANLPPTPIRVSVTFELYKSVKLCELYKSANYQTNETYMSASYKDYNPINVIFIRACPYFQHKLQLVQDKKKDIKLVVVKTTNWSIITKTGHLVGMFNVSIMFSCLVKM